MSAQSEAAKKHIASLLEDSYPFLVNWDIRQWYAEYRFAKPRLWRFDYAVPSILCAILRVSRTTSYVFSQGVIELDGGTFQQHRSGHTTGVALRTWREKNNAAMSLGWRVWHYAPDEIIKAGRKTLPDEPILKRLPWLD